MAQAKHGSDIENTQDDLLNKAQVEFHSVINTFILPLCDSRGNLKLVKKPSMNTALVSYVENGKNSPCLYFFPCISRNGHTTPFCYKVKTYSPKSIVKRLNVILRELLKVTEYNCFDGKIRKQRDYGNGKRRYTSYKNKTLQLAFELGMCSWLAPHDGAFTLHAMLCRMEEWASKTYEGSSVPFGFVVDFDAKANKDAASYLSFLQNDCSAVFTDGVFSGIRLDQKGRVLSFITRNTPIKNHQPENEMFVPYQFSDIAQHCSGNAIGVIVLTNGEILLVKKRAICFAKRGTKWVSFDWDRIRSQLLPYFLTTENADMIDIERKIKIIYNTILDVSFSHVGGCLSIIVPDIDDNEISKVIKERFDLSVAGKLPDGVSSESKEKIKVLSYLLVDNNFNIRSFFELDAPLRKEILSLDGATVVSLDGSFYCAGSIVAVPSGSTGGGRTAAAKKLAHLGVGIKISEDGYVEAYGLPSSKTSVKSEKKERMDLLFGIR